MRTVVAMWFALASAPQAVAHEGHGETGFHWHAGDLLSLLAMVTAVALWLWQRSRR